MTTPLISAALAVIAVIVITFVLRAAGPAVLGDRTPPPALTRIVALMAPVLLAGLLVTELGGAGWRSLDWTLLAGVAAAGVAKTCRAPMLLAGVVGIVTTAALRYLTS
jgi:branched-subunit amino acid transport protein AzlD